MGSMLPLPWYYRNALGPGILWLGLRLGWGLGLGGRLSTRGFFGFFEGHGVWGSSISQGLGTDCSAECCYFIIFRRDRGVLVVGVVVMLIEWSGLGFWFLVLGWEGGRGLSEAMEDE